MKVETKVIGCVLVVLLSLELAVRWIEPRLSADVRNMKSHASIVDSVRLDRNAGRTSILILGNSLARAAIDRDMMMKAFLELGHFDPQVYFMAPDASGINEWTAAYRKYFSRSGVHPDFIFILTGPGHIFDHPVRSPEKLAAFHACWADYGMVLRNWMHSGNERARFGMSAVSNLFANRERIRPLIFYHTIPRYAEVAQVVNRKENRNLLDGAKQTRLKRLKLLLESRGDERGNAFVVAVPMPKEYRLPKKLSKLLEDYGGRLYHESSWRAWPRSAFPDGYHLGRGHALEFTREIMEGLDITKSPPIKLNLYNNNDSSQEGNRN